LGIRDRQYGKSQPVFYLSAAQSGRSQARRGNTRF
jgi:hypothetical protein